MSKYYTAYDHFVDSSLAWHENYVPGDLWKTRDGYALVLSRFRPAEIEDEFYNCVMRQYQVGGYLIRLAGHTYFISLFEGTRVFELYRPVK